MTTTLRLRPPRHRVQRRAIALWAVQSLLIVVPVIAAPAVTAVLLPQGPSIDRVVFWLVVATVVVGVLGAAITVLMPVWRYAVHRWEVTDEAVYTASGWLWQEWRVAPMSRIQTVDTKRTPLQRVLGLASVTVTTASAAGPLVINGLDARRASEIAAQLTETTQATPGDAT